jgi:hypothetical protein
MHCLKDKYIIPGNIINITMFTFLTRILELVKIMTTGMNIVTCGDSQSPIIILYDVLITLSKYTFTLFYEVCVSMSEQELDFQKYINNLSSINIILSCKKH